MQVTREHLTSISEIYDTVLDAEAWTGMLERLTGFAGAKAAHLFGIDAVDHRRFAIEKTSRLFRPSDLEEYHRDYAHYEGDPWRVVQMHPAGTFVTDEMVWPDREAFRQRPDVVWLLERHNILHRVGIKVSNTPAYTVGMVFNYEYGRPPSTTAEQESFKILLPHLRQAVDINRTFFLLRSQLNGLTRALDMLRFGVCILTDSGHLAITNAAARSMLQRNDGLRHLRDGSLAAASPDVTQSIKRAAQDVSLTASAEGLTAQVKLTVPRNSGGLPYILEFAPLRDMSGQIDRNLCGAVLLIIDPEDTRFVSVDGLGQVLGLSTAEREVADLIVRGMSNTEIAERRNVSPETIKSQVTNVLQKADCTRRIDLVRLAMAISLPMFNDGSPVAPNDGQKGTTPQY